MSKRWTEQRWALDSIIQANGVDSGPAPIDSIGMRSVVSKRHPISPEYVSV